MMKTFGFEEQNKYNVKDVKKFINSSGIAEFSKLPDIQPPSISIFKIDLILIKTHFYLNMECIMFKI